MSRTSCDPTFGATLRRLRHDRGLSLRELAQRAYLGKSTLSDLENGRSAPTTATAEQLDQVLNAAGALVALVWPTNTPPTLATPAPSPSRPLTAADVDTIRDTIGHLVAVDTSCGSQDIFPTAQRLFRASVDKLATGAYTPAVERDLQAVVGELGEVAGWLAYDADQQTNMRHLTLEAMTISRLAGDRSMELLQLANLSMQAVHLRRGQEALTVAHHTLDHSPLPPLVRGLFHLRLGRAYALLGNRADATGNMDRAHHLISAGAGADDPAWTWWLDQSELLCHQASMWRDLGNRHKAITLMRASVEAVAPRKRAARYLLTVMLARELAAAKAWTDLQPVLVDVIDLGGQVASPRTTRMINSVATGLCQLDPPPPGPVLDLARLLATRSPAC